VAEEACRRLNSQPSGLECAGFESPGFVSVSEMSCDENIAKINASHADLLVVALGAKKGQAWIEKNRLRIKVPVISHLGAVMNFVAGTVTPAPDWAQRAGLEWLWRIKEEPGLWRRYIFDGTVLLRLLLMRVVPYAWFVRSNRPASREIQGATSELFDRGGECVMCLRGAWVRENLLQLRARFSEASLSGNDILLDMGHVTYVDSAFLGLLMLLYGDRKRQDRRLRIVNASKRVRRIFRYSCAEFLLE